MNADLAEAVTEPYYRDDLEAGVAHRHRWADGSLRAESFTKRGCL